MSSFSACLGPASLRQAALAGTILGLLAGAAEGQAREPVDLELVIAVDVSNSVDRYEARLQREGYVSAFSDDRVVEAIQSGFLGRIAVYYFEWAGAGHMRPVMEWTVIEDVESARAFAAELGTKPYSSARRTSISEAIDFAVPQFERNDYDGKRKVIDISGDGANNWGRLVTLARDEAVAAGITINGLPILEDGPGYGSSFYVPHLDLYFEHCVIGGRGAFMIAANGFEDFANAIRQKLVLEIAGRTPDGAPERHAEASTAGPLGLSRPTDGRPLDLAQDRGRDRPIPPCNAGERRGYSFGDGF